METIETGIFQIQQGYFFTLSLELVSYDGKDKKTIKGKMGGCAPTYSAATTQLDQSKQHLERELRK